MKLTKAQVKAMKIENIMWRCKFPTKIREEEIAQEENEAKTLANSQEQIKNRRKQAWKIT